MTMKTYIPQNMYEVKAGRTKMVIKCADQNKLEELIEKKMIDEYRVLRVFKID